MSSADIVIRTEELAKTFTFGLLRRKVRALRGVSFTVERGEIFGFLGPNGAGKSTTIKLLMGLLFPSGGRCELLGRKVPDVEAKRRLGFLPESPYFYDYLTGAELLDLVGRLFELPPAVRRRRAEELLARVGLERAAGLPLRKYSKGMLQRVGLAQALVNQPELVVLDEPMSGLDPVGRKEIRDLIAALRQEGTTVFFSTHILSDVELLCDRCAILVDGRLRDVGPLDQLLSPRLLHTEVVLERAGKQEERRLAPGEDVNAFLQAAMADGAHVVSVTPRRERLEDLFVREVTRGENPAAPEASAPSASASASTSDR
jgi:ABC-2 type transport system ATP-binding protein